MRLPLAAVLLSFVWCATAPAAGRPVAPALRPVAEALVPLPATAYQQQEGVVAAERYVAFVDVSGRIRAWDSRARRIAATVPPPAEGTCVPRSGRHDEFVVYCPAPGGRAPYLLTVTRGSLEPIRLPAPFEQGWYVADVGRRWFEVRSGADQYFIDRLTGASRRGGNLDEPGYILVNRDLDDPDLGPWLREHEMVYRDGVAFWKGPRGRLVRAGREGSRSTPLLTYGRFATWLDARFAAAFDTRTRRRYRWRLRAVPAGLYLPHTDHAAIFVVGPVPRRVPDDEPIPFVRARILAARWLR